MHRLLVCVLALCLSAATALAVFRITPEQPIADPLIAPAEGQSIASAVVSDGDTFMIFWAGPGGVHATRVSAAGEVIGSPRVLVPVASTIRSLSACWSGSSYVITWQQDEGDALYAAAITAEGSVNSTPQLISLHARSSSRNIASNGKRVLVAYGVITGSILVDRCALLDDNANVITTGLAPLGDTPSGVDQIPVVASDRNEFALVWTTIDPPPAGPIPLITPPPLTQTYNDFHLLRLDENGNAIGKEIGVGQTYPVQYFGVASANGRYAIATIEGSLSGQQHLVRIVVDPPTSTAVRLPPIDVKGYEPNVFWNGGNFVAYWMDYDFNDYKLMTVAFSGDAEAATPNPVIAASAAHFGERPNIGSDGQQTFAAWSEDTYDTRDGNLSIIGQRFDRNVTSAETHRVLLSAAWSRQFSPSIATSGSDSLIVWIDQHELTQGGAVFAARVAANGAVIDRTPIVVADSVTAGAPQVIFNGSSYLVIWIEAASSVVARTVARDGTLGARTVLGDGWSASAASNGSVTLVAMATHTGILADRLDARGQQIDAQPVIVNANGMFGPHVATNGTDFLVAWNFGSDIMPGQFPPPPNMIDVLGARVTAGGEVLDPTAIEIATGPADQIVAAVASDGRDYLVLYDNNQSSIAAKRVLRDGTLDGTPGDVGSVITNTIANPVIIGDGAGGYTIALTPINATGFEFLETDARGTPGEITTVPTDTVVNALSLTQTAGRMVEIVYARRVNDGLFAPTSRVLLRVAGDLASRSRAVRR